MGHGPGNEVSNPTDERLRKRTITLLRILDHASQQRDFDLRQYREDLRRLKERIKRPHKDEKEKKALLDTIEDLIYRLELRLTRSGLKRKVSITKISSNEGPLKKRQGPIVGWEEAPPIVGRRYRVFREDGGVLSTAPVSKIASGFVRTENSVYQIEILEQKRL